MRSNTNGGLPARRNHNGGVTSLWNGNSGLLSPFMASPFQLMRRMQDDMDRLFSQALGSSIAPNMDFSETDSEFCIDVDLPGLPPDSVDIRVQEGMLTLRAELQNQDSGAKEEPQEQPSRHYHTRERRYGYIERSISLPPNVDEQNIRAEFKNGVLTVYLPKSQIEQAQGRRIPVTASGRTLAPTESNPTTEETNDAPADKPIS
ncbi:MAG: Hsp20/alpha crystallin family protein [Armatimonas sp.]